MSETPRTPEPDEPPTEREADPSALSAGDPLRRDAEPAPRDAGEEPTTPAAGEETPPSPVGEAPTTPTAGDEPAPDPLASGPERPAAEAHTGARAYATGPDTDLRAAYAPPAPPPRRFTRSSSDRMVGGVAGGLGRYFDIDPLILRIAFVVLTFAGGFGIFAYLIALVAVPADDAPGPHRWGLARTLGAGLLIAAACGVILPNWFWGPELPVLLVAGVVIYLLVRVLRDDGATHLGRMAARIALGIALLSLAAAGFAAAAAGSALGGGILISGLVIAIGVALVGGSFRGGARWLIVPAFVLALPLGVVSAANLDIEGDWGERTFRPATVQALAGGYEMGVGHMQVDLRRLDLPAGRTELPLTLGVGEIDVAVPDDVCVTYDIEVGAGEVATLDAINDDGVDLDVAANASVPPGVPELHVIADVGLGRVAIGRGFPLGDFRGFDSDRIELDLGGLDGSPLNTACRVAS